MSPQTDRLGFLLADVSRLMRHAYERHAHDSDPTLAQARVLLYVQRNEGARQIDLAEMLEVQPITLARLIDHLVAQGLVERRASPHDRRAHCIYLTEAAHPQLQAINRATDAIKQEALHGLSAQQIKALSETLQVIRANLSGR